MSKIKKNYTVVSWISAHGPLNITSDFGLHGHLPGIYKLHMFIWKLLLEIWYMGAYPGAGTCPGLHSIGQTKSMNLRN